MAHVEENPDSGFALLGLVPSQSAPASAPGAGAPLTRRQVRELENAANPQQMTYVATPLPSREPSPPPVDFPRRSAAPAQATRAQRGTAKRRRTIKRLAGSTPRKANSSAGSKLLSLGAMLFAGALLVGMSVPANAFMTDASAVATATPVTEKVPAQSLEVSPDVVEAAPTRDTFEVISYAEVLKLKYSNMSANYTVTTGAVRWPFPYFVPTTDGFGPRYMCDGCSNFHKGVDFVPGEGTPIYAIADGVVTQALEDYASGYGNHVLIQHKINGQDVESLYAHMLSDSRAVNVGDVVKVGDFLGLVGNTGTSYGAHLHLEIHLDKVPVDPFAWLQANAVN